MLFAIRYSSSMMRTRAFAAAGETGNGDSFLNNDEWCPKWYHYVFFSTRTIKAKTRVTIIMIQQLYRLRDDSTRRPAAMRRRSFVERSLRLKNVFIPKAALQLPLEAAALPELTRSSGRSRMRCGGRALTPSSFRQWEATGAELLRARKKFSLRRESLKKRLARQSAPRWKSLNYLALIMGVAFSWTVPALSRMAHPHQPDQAAHRLPWQIREWSGQDGGSRTREDAAAVEIHSFGIAGLVDHIVPSFKKILGTGKLLFGVGIVENAYDQTALIEAIPADNILDREPELLDTARRNMPKLPVEAIDVLIVDRMGKELSGVGMDPNIIGRLAIRGQPEPHRRASPQYWSPRSPSGRMGMPSAWDSPT